MMDGKRPKNCEKYFKEFERLWKYRNVEQKINGSKIRILRKLARNANPLPDYEELRRIFEYEAITGDLFWRERGPGRRLDEPAGFVHSGRKYLRLDGVNYSVARIIFAMHNPGYHYYFIIEHKDGDFLNTRIENLEAKKIDLPNEIEELYI